MIANKEFLKYNIAEDEIYLPLCGNDIDEVHRMKYQMYLDKTDYIIIKNAEWGLSVPEDIKESRQESRDQINLFKEKKNDD